MAKTSSVITHSGPIGNIVYYTRFGKTFARAVPATINDRKSPAQRQQRELFTARQQTAALFGSILQRGLSKAAHKNALTEANLFSRLNKDQFVYENGKVLIDYKHLQLSLGNLRKVIFEQCHADGLHVHLSFIPAYDKTHGSPNDIVHIYAVEPQVKICHLVASVPRREGLADFLLPELSGDADANTPPTFLLYAIVESATSARIPTLSADEKRVDKQHRNINRRVSDSIFIGVIHTK